jgi:hypothetical protein
MTTMGGMMSSQGAGKVDMLSRGGFRDMDGCVADNRE